MQYDVALSFAGEDREYVDQVANYLRRKGVNVFYDKYEKVDLWGKDLYEHLSDVYQNKARFTVIFISRHYAEKLWPRHERKNAQARAFRESKEYILPARFDDTAVPGLPETISYLDIRKMPPADCAEAICEKLVRDGVALAPETAQPREEQTRAVAPPAVNITVQEENGTPISGAEILLVASNGTYQEGRTNAQGGVSFEIAKRRMLTVFCAHPKCPAFVVPEFDPILDIKIKLPKTDRVGSFTTVRGWCTLPGLKGSMDPIHDSSNRLYVYTKNIAVDGGKGQPVQFQINKPLHFEDSDGNQQLVTFVAVIGDCFLVEHKSVS